MDHQIVPESLLWKDTPKEEVGNYEYLLDVIDWDLNLDPELRKHRFMPPLPARPPEETERLGWRENWICYKSTAVSAKELTVLPGCTVKIHDSAAYGMIMMQGHGSMNGLRIETPAMIRFGELTFDEYFISEDTAEAGVTIINESSSEPIVMLKHFGPGNPDLGLPV